MNHHHQVVQEYERAVIFRLGRLVKVRLCVSNNLLQRMIITNIVMIIKLIIKIAIMIITKNIMMIISKVTIIA